MLTVVRKYEMFICFKRISHTVGNQLITMEFLCLDLDQGL